MRLKLIFASVIALLGIYGVFWFKMADEAKKLTLDWIENSEERFDGTKLYVGDVTVSGFPYKIAIEIATFNAVIPSGKFGNEPLLLSAPNVAVVYQPWNPTHAIIVTDYIDGVIGELEDPTLSMDMEKVMISVKFDLDTLALNNLSTTMDLLSWQHGLQNDGHAMSVLEKPQFHLRRSTSVANEGQSYDLPVSRAFYFKAENALINELEGTVLGKNADQIKIETLLHANEQPDYTVAGLSRWRDDGGTLSIRTFEYGTEEAGLSLSGDMTLDQKLRPLGAFDASVTGIGELFLRLSKNENIPEIARLMLKSQSEAKQLPKAVPLSISMQNGQMYLGPIMVMELPAVIQ